MNWISIKDKLPEENEIVVAWDEDGNGGWEEAYLKDEIWYRLQEEEFTPTILPNVTHWFLPIKPK